MKNWIGIIAGLLLLSVMPTVEAAKSERDSYLLVNEDQKSLISFIDQENMYIEQSYQTLPIVEANLTKTELSILKEKFPSMSSQVNVVYQISAETVLPSLPLVKGEPKSTFPYTGKGISVAVLDSGIDTEHRDLRVAGGYCAKAIKCSSNIPYDDNNGHGTHVAGVIAGLANGTGIIGVAPSVELYSVKVLSEMGVGTTKSIIDGIDWAIKNNIDILNLSITTTNDDLAMEIALQEAYNQGILIIGAAGNNGGGDVNTVTYPAKYPSVIAVAGVNEDKTKLEESSIGEEVELSAPGGNIFSTYPIEWDFYDDRTDGYTTLSGTSMAAPHAAGIAALYMERFPEMTNEEVRQLLVKTSKDIGLAGKDHVFGHGLVQYSPAIQGTATIQIAEDNGKATIQLSNLPIEKVTADRAVFKNGQGLWEFYGVSGIIPLDITTNTSKGSLTERKYIKLSEPLFTDVSNSQWFSEHIGYLTHRKQIFGLNDDTFLPYREITRGEAAALIGRALGYEGRAVKTKFKDVPTNYFASGYIQQAVDEGIITGFNDGTFRPGDKVTRAEMAILISKAFKLEGGDEDAVFKDMSPSMASYQAILALVHSGVTKGYKDGTFRPYDLMTRSQFAVFLARTQNDKFQ